MTKNIKLTNTSVIPNCEAKILIDFAYQFVFGKVLLPPEIKVKLTNTRYHWKGWALPCRVLLRIGKHFPFDYQYPRLKTAEKYTIHDRREALVSLAAHEFWHCYQFRLNHLCSEIECEQRAVSTPRLTRDVPSFRKRNNPKSTKKLLRNPRLISWCALRPTLPGGRGSSGWQRPS